MLRYPLLATAAIAAALVVGAGAGYLIHPDAGHAKAATGLITKFSTKQEVEAHFNLGTNAEGRTLYRDTSCYENLPAPVCLWSYWPSDHSWAITFMEREPKGSIAHGPPMSD